MSEVIRIFLETLADLDNLLCIFGGKVNLQAMTHIEYLVGFCIVGTAFLDDGLEERRNGEHVVLDNPAVVTHEM